MLTDCVTQMEAGPDHSCQRVRGWRSDCTQRERPNLGGEEGRRALMGNPGLGPSRDCCEVFYLWLQE